MMKLSSLLKTAAAGLVAANFSAQEAKAQTLGDFLQEGLRQYQEHQDRNGSGGFRFDAPGGRRPSCHQDWYRSDGNRGGTFDPCNGEPMPREGFKERPTQNGRMQDCYATTRSGQGVTGRSRDCGSDPNTWQNLHYR